MSRTTLTVLFAATSAAFALNTGAVRPLDPATEFLGGIVTSQYHGDAAFNGTSYFVPYAQNDGLGSFTQKVRLKRCRADGTVLDSAALSLGGNIGVNETIAAAAAPDGRVLVVWEDQRDGNRDIYGSLVAANRTLISPGGGFPIATLASDEKYPSVAFSGTQFFVAWKNQGAIRGRRVALDGTLSDGAATVAAPQLATTDSSINGPRLSGDGAGSWLMGWDNGTAKLQVVSSAGTLTGTEVSLTGKYPVSAWNGTHWLTVFNNNPGGGNLHVFGTRVNPDGTLVDTAAGFAIAQNSTVQELAPVVAASGSDWLVAWQDRVGAVIRFSARIVEANGAIQGAVDDRGVTAISPGQFGPQVAGDGSGGWLLTGTTVIPSVAAVGRAYVVKLGDLRAAQTIAAPTVEPHFLNDAPFLVALPSTTSKGLPVTVENLTPSVISLAGNLVSPLAKGTAQIRLSHPGTASVAAAVQTVSFEILGRRQTLSLPGVPQFPGVGTLISLGGAVSDLGFPVMVSLVEGPATLSGTDLTITGAGKVVIRFSAPGDATTEAATVDVEVAGDSARPSVSITSPNSGGNVTSPAFAFEGTAGDDFALAGVEFRLNGGAWVAATLSPATPQSVRDWQAVISQSRDLVVGENIIEARAWDLAGQFSVVARRQIFYTPVDTTAPQISVASPLAGPPVPAISGLALAELRGTAFDNASLAAIEFRLNGGEWFSIDGNTNWVATLKPSHGLKKGLNTAEVQAVDASGLRSAKVTRQFKFAFAAADDKTAPAVVFSAPAAGAQAAGTLAITGTASDAAGVAAMEYRVNEGVWQAVDSFVGGPSATWGITALANPGGTQALEVRGFDSAGNVSKPAKRAFSRAGSGVVEIKTLLDGTPSTAGGTAGPVADGATIAFGKPLTLVAKPNAGFVFIGWRTLLNGVPTGESRVPVLKLPMQQGLRAEAQFSSSVFVPTGAGYAGLVGTTSHAQSGTISVFATKTGAFTGSLLFGSAVHPLKGALDGNGEAALTIERKGATPLNVRIQAGSDALTGIVEDGAEPNGFSVPRLAQFAKGTTAPQTGFHTIAFGPEADIGEPHGFSVGSLTVAKTGTVKVSGKMSDGSAFSAAAALDVTDGISFGTLLYKGAGKVTGNWTLSQITSGPLAGKYAGTGNGRWVKETTSSGIFPGAFSIGLDTHLSAYLTQSKREPVTLTDATVDITLTRFDNDDNIAQTWATSIEKTGAVGAFTPTTESPSMKLSVPKGTFSGTFSSLKFSGVILQSEKRGVGSYIDGTGKINQVQFTLTP